jgi:hypothetical protein
MRILTFTLSHLATGNCVGLALICSEARYASVAWRGIDRLDRKLVTVDEWRAFQSARRDHFSPSPFERDHVVARMLVPVAVRHSITVQYLADRPLEATKPIGVTDLLDGELRRQAAAATKRRPEKDGPLDLDSAAR